MKGTTRPSFNFEKFKFKFLKNLKQKNFYYEKIYKHLIKQLKITKIKILMEQSYFVNALFFCGKLFFPIFGGKLRNLDKILFLSNGLFGFLSIYCKHCSHEESFNQNMMKK